MIYKIACTCAILLAAAYAQTNNQQVVGTSSSPYNALSFGHNFYNLFVNDASAPSSSPMQGCGYCLPLINLTVSETGTGTPVALYGYAFNSSPGANNAEDRSNSVGIISGCTSQSNDTHSGCWGANFLAIAASPSRKELSLFGTEVNVFENRLDPGRFSTTPTHRAVFGFAATSSGTYTGQVGSVCVFGWYTCFMGESATDVDFAAGIPGAQNGTTFGFASYAQNPATSSQNYPSMPYALFGSTWSGSAAQDDEWYFDVEPAVSGTNPLTSWVLRHCVGASFGTTGTPCSGTNLFDVDSGGDVHGAGNFSGNNIPIVGSITTTASSYNTLAMTPIASTSHCTFSATNSTAAALTGVYISKSTNLVTLYHSATAGGTFDVMCTPN
jgi:hypothetical protein